MQDESNELKRSIQQKGREREDQQTSRDNSHGYPFDSGNSFLNFHDTPSETRVAEALHLKVISDVELKQEVGVVDVKIVN